MKLPDSLNTVAAIDDDQRSYLLLKLGSQVVNFNLNFEQ